MKKYLIHSKIVLSVFFYFEIFSIVSAQNIYNSGASVNISSGIIVRGGSLSNTSGVIHNDGTLTLGGNLTNASSILGNGTYNLAADYINSGTFTPNSSTVVFNGTSQAIGGANATTFNNLTLAGSGTKTFSLSTIISALFDINTGVVANLGTGFIHRAGSLTLNGSAQATSSSYGGTTSPATTINPTYFTTNTGILNVGTFDSYSLTSTYAAAICEGGLATIDIENTTPADLPIGTYEVFYTLTGANTGSSSSTMVVTTAGTGSFITSALANSGATTITINYLTNGCVSSTTSGNTASITINAVPVAPVIAKVPTDATVCSGTTLTMSLTTAGTGGAVSSQHEYRYTTDNGTSWSTWGTTEPIFAGVTGTNTIESRRISTGSGCTTSSSNSVSWIVNLNFTPGAIDTEGETICYGGNPSLIGSTTAASGGDGTIVYQWKADNTDISGANNATYVPLSGLTATTTYTRFAKDATCNTIYEMATGSWIVTVQSTPTAGSIGTAQLICNNTIPSSLTSENDGSGDGTISYRWESNTNLTIPSWSPISGEFTATYAPEALTETTQYRRITISTLNGVICESVSTVPVQISVTPALNAGTIPGGNVTLCSGINSVTLTLEGAVGDIQWMYAVTEFGSYRTLWGQNSNTLVVSNSTGNRTYYYFAKVSDYCSTTVKYSNKIAITVLNPVSGTISGAGSVCSGNAKTINLGTHSGTVQWQSSSDNFNTSINTISGATGNSYITDSLTTATYYRVVVTNGSCGSATSASVMVTVDEPVEAGSISQGNIAVCYGNPAPLTLSGNSTGTIIWYKSINYNTGTNTGTWTAVTGQTTTALASGNLTVATWYKAKMTNGACSDETPIVKVTVNPLSTVKTISGAGAICNGASKLLTLATGSVGSLQWQSSTTSATALDFTDIIGNTSLTYNATPTTKAWYRVVSKSGVCSSVNSVAVAVTVSQPTSVGTLSALAETLCAGTGTTLSLTSAIGTIAWQKATVTNGVPGTFVAVAANTSTTLVTGNLTASAAYRVVVSSGVCATSTSNVVIVTVNPISTVKTISGAGAICNGASKLLTLATGSVGSLQWQSSTTSATALDFADIGNTSLTYNATPTTTTWYRVVSKSGVCSSVYSVAVAVTVSQPTSVGTLSALAETLCAGTGTTLSLTSATGTIAWQKATVTNGIPGTFVAVAANTSTTLVTGNLTASVAYRVVVSSGVCTTSTSNVVIVAVSPAAKVAAITGFNTATTKACVGLQKTLSLSTGYIGTIEWLSSPTLTGSYTVISGQTASTYVYTPLANGVMYFKVRTTSSPCSVQAISTTGVAVWADAVICSRGQVEIVSDEFKVMVYPNPSANLFNLEVTTPTSSKRKEFDVKVYDILGRLIEQRQVQQSNNIEVGSNYPSGLYSINVTQGQQVKTIRVIKK